MQKKKVNFRLPKRKTSLFKNLADRMKSETMSHSANIILY